MTISIQYSSKIGNKKGLKLPVIKGCSLYETISILTSIVILYAFPSFPFSYLFYDLPEFFKTILGKTYWTCIIIKVILIISLFIFTCALSMKKNKYRRFFLIQGMGSIIGFSLYLITTFIITVQRLKLLDGLSNTNNYSENAKKSLNYLLFNCSFYTIIMFLFLLVLLLYVIQALIIGEEESNNQGERSIERYKKLLQKSSVFGLIGIIVVAILDTLLIYKRGLFITILFLVINAVFALCLCLMIYIANKKDLKKMYNTLDYIKILFFVVLFKFTVIFNIFKLNSFKEEEIVSYKSYDDYINNYKQVKELVKINALILCTLYLITYYYFVSIMCRIATVQEIIKEEDNEIIMSTNMTAFNKNEESIQIEVK